MSSAAYDVVGLGNAIVDLIAPTTDAALIEHGIAKGGMTLIDDARALYLTGLYPEAAAEAGGSAANTATGVASFGGRAAFLGKVSDDALGAQFTASFQAQGVRFDGRPRLGPPGTARCIILVTPDGQRSMNTYLGASTHFAPEDIDAALIQASEVLFLEGYLFDRPEAKAAFVRAAEIARAAGRKVALTLSDRFCVDRHRDSFRHLVAGHVDLLFANESEITALYETQDFGAALEAATAACPIVAATRSELGSVAAAGSERVTIAAEPVARVLDTTGAGDQYAAGFLFGLARGRSLAECGRLGSIAAAEVIAHIGPRPEVSLAGLAAKAGIG